MTSCSKLARESSRRILGKQRFVRERVRIEEAQKRGESMLHGKTVVAILKRQIEIFPKEDGLRL